MTASALQAVTIDATVLSGIRGYNLDRRERMLSPDTDGTLHQTFHAAKRAAPKVDFSTVAVESLMGILTGSLDAPMKNITTAVDFCFALQASATPGYNGTHRGIRLTKGHIYLAGLRWSPGADGLEAACSAFGLSADGTTDPVSLITPTLPTVTPVEVFTLTSLTLGGLAVTKCSSLDIGIDAKAENNVEEVCYDLGLPHPKEMAVAGAAGPIEVSGTVEMLDQGGAPTTSGSLIAEFTQYAFGATLSANTLTVTINAALIREEARTGGRPSTRRFKILGRHDGTNRPITIATS